MPRSRSRGARSDNAMAGFGCKELRRYSPTHVFVPDDYYTPMGQCVPYDPIMHSDTYGPHAIQLYTPPPPATPTSVPFPSSLPIPVTHFLPFMIPPCHDPYGPTAVQIYSPYTPPVVKMRSIRDVIGLGQDSDAPMPYHQNEATPFQYHSMFSALPTSANVDFSTSSLHNLVCPVLGLVLMVALGVSTLFCALKKLRQHEPVAADTTGFEEYYSVLSSVEEISGLERLPLQERDNIPKNDKTTRTEQLSEHRASRINGSSASGAPAKIKFAPGRRRLRTELLKESRVNVHSSTSVPLVPRKRRLRKKEYLYVLSISHYEPSIAGTFPYLYCADLMYRPGKRGRYDTQDGDNSEVQNNISKPFSTHAINIGFEENILGTSSLEEVKNIERNHFKEDENCHHISMDDELFETEPSRTHDRSSSNIAGEVSEEPRQQLRLRFKEELNNIEHIHFEQKEECDCISGNEKSFEIEQLIDHTESRTNGCSSTHIPEEASAEPSEDELNRVERKHFELKEECDPIPENDKSFEIEQLIDHTESKSDGCSSTDIPEEASAEPSEEELNSIEHKHFEQKEECDNISVNDKSLEIDRLNDHTESITNDRSSSTMAEDISAEPSEDHSLIDPQNVNNLFAEEQMSAQSSPSDDGDNFDFKEKLSEPSTSSSVLTVVDPNNLEEKEKCRHIPQNDNLNETRTCKTKLWDSSTQQQSGSRWYIAAGMGKNKKHPLTTIQKGSGKAPTLQQSRTSKNKLWESSTLQQSGSRWYIATGMGKNKKDPLTKSKVTAKSSKVTAAPRLTSTTSTMQPAQSLCSVSFRLFGFGANKSTSTIVKEVNDEPRTAEEVIQ